MRTTTLKWLAAGALPVAALAALATSADTPERAADAPTPALDPAAEVALEAADGRAPGCAFTPGVEMAFSLTTRDRLTLDVARLGAPAGLTPDVTAATTARLELRALSRDGDGAVLLARFAEVDADTLRDTAPLRAPFLVRLGARCAIDGFAHLADARPEFARAQQVLLHELSWSWPASGAVTFEGANNLGRFTARAAAARDRAGTITHEVTAFTPWRRGPDALERVTHGAIEVTPGAAPWFARLTSRARLTGPLSELEHTATATYLGAHAPSLAGASADETDYAWSDLLPRDLPITQRAAPGRAERDALDAARRLTVAQAVDAYVARVQDDAVGVQDTWPGLRTFLEAKPEAAREVLDALKRAELPGEATMGVYIALGNARTDQARVVLDEVMRDESAPVIERARAVLALIDRDDVGPALADYLGDQSRMLASGENRGQRVMARQSLLALGAMAGRRPHDLELRRAALTRVSALLDETRDLGALYQRPIYGAIANVGDPAALDRLAHIPDHPDPEVREVAAIVTRRMPPAASAAFTARWLATETHPSVLRKLWHTVELQTFDARAPTSPEVLGFALRDLRARPGPITRKALIRLLARALAASPDDPLGIEDAFAELIPFELEQRSGLHTLMHDHVDDQRLQRLYDDHARAGSPTPRDPNAPGDSHARPSPALPSPAAPHIGGRP